MATTPRATENIREDAERVRAERRLGDMLSGALLFSGILVMVLYALHYLNEYFGAEDRWDAIADGADDFTALTNLLRDLAEGFGIGMLLIGLSWVVARTLLRMTRDDNYVTVGTGRAETTADRVTRRES
jgi:hypothetical protein